MGSQNMRTHANTRENMRTHTKTFGNTRKHSKVVAPGWPNIAQGICNRWPIFGPLWARLLWPGAATYGTDFLAAIVMCCVSVPNAFGSHGVNNV
jgi:hypothetical protein